MGVRGAGVVSGKGLLATEDNQAEAKVLKDGDILEIVQQAVDMCTGRLIGLG